MPERWRRLTKSDLPGFDADSVALVEEMGAAGWVGRLSSKGHAILRAPDGQATHSVSRDSKRARSGRNARAYFDRWARGQLTNEGRNDQ